MTIEDLYELAVNNLTNEHIMLDLGIIDGELAAKIIAETGVDLTGFVISIDNYGIRHAIERHRDEKKGKVNRLVFQTMFITKKRRTL